MAVPLDVRTRRLLGRYLLNNPVFVVLALRQLLSTRETRSRTHRKVASVVVQLCSSASRVSRGRSGCWAIRSRIRSRSPARIKGR